MIVIFIVVSLIITFLIFVMFLILKKTVSIVNDQTKSYFVNKLQSYDDLIQDKETKLQEIDDLIRDREKGLNKEGIQENNNQTYAFDTNVLNLMNSTKYQDQNIFELNKKIDENFVVNYEELVKDFLHLCDDSSDYEFCLNMREKFDSDIIYKLKIMLPNDREKELKGMLSNKEYKIYEAFKLVANENNVDNFIDYLDQLVVLNNPKVTILVGNRSENYDHLSDNIETVFNDKIYRGIKIIYKNKVYDFSLSERNV